MQKSADAFRTISEVADDLDLPQHVLRFWETRFLQIRPLKRAGGRRYYRPADVVLLKTIRQLLYDDGYTIKGVQRLLKEHGAKGIGDAPRTAPLQDEEGPTDVETPEAEASYASPPMADEDSMLSAVHRDTIVETIATIDECRRILEAARRRPS